MTKVQNWTISLLALVALAVGVLMISGAVSSAQEGSTTPTPAASATDDATATPAPESTDDADSDTEGDTEDRTDDGTEDGREGGDKDGNGIPDDEETTTDTSTT